MTTYRAITTCNAAGWETYGRNMARSFARYWPAEVPLAIYAEGFVPDVFCEALNLETQAKWLEPWKAAHRHLKPVDFRQDAVRFSHKVAAIGAAADGPDGILIWIDADTVTHSPVTVEWLDRLFPQRATVAWLDRWATYPECGFLMFRLPEARQLLAEVVRLYQTDELFQLPAWTDCHAIQHVVEAAVKRGGIQVASLSGDAKGHGHPLINGPLGACIDHLKGRRKERGRSHAHDLMRPRREEYWRA
jgi:hypothetical protein